MNEKKENKPNHPVPTLFHLLAFLLLLILTGVILYEKNVDSTEAVASEIDYYKVKKDTLNEEISITGVVQPFQVVQISPYERGVVSKQVAEEGTMVKKGDVIMELTNNSLDLEILNAEANLAEKQNFLRNTRVVMEQERLKNENELLEQDINIARKKRAYTQYKRLFDEELIAHEQYIKAEEDYRLARQKHKLILERLKQDSIFRSLQVLQLEENLEKMHQTLILIRDRKENLKVKAQINGQIGKLQVMIGESVSPSSKLGEINDLSEYKIEVSVPEKHIDHFNQHMSARCIKNGKSYPLSVERIYPNIINNSFIVELHFQAKRPVNLHRGQSLSILIPIQTNKPVITIPHGDYLEQTEGKWLLVVNPRMQHAQKRNIKIGRKSREFVEVVSGLKSGEEIIISDYSPYLDVERVKLTE